MSHSSHSAAAIRRSLIPGLLLAGAILTFSSVAASAQGVGLNLGPMFLLSDVVPGSGTAPAGGMGFSLGIDYLSVVDDGGIISYGILYTSVPFDNDSIHALFGGSEETTLELASRKSLGFMTSVRFRIGADLDEIAPIINLKGGGAFLFGGDGKLIDGDSEVELDLSPEIPVAVQGSLAAGIDYPFPGNDEIALVGTVGPLLELTFAKGFDGPEVDFGVTGILLSIGIEYRTE